MAQGRAVPVGSTHFYVQWTEKIMLHVGLIVAGLTTTYGPAKIPVFPGAELPALLARLRYDEYGEIIPLDLYNYQMGMGNHSASPTAAQSRTSTAKQRWR
jgi:hypothetical protein